MPLEMLAAIFCCELGRRSLYGHFLITIVGTLICTPYWCHSIFIYQDWFFIMKVYSVTLIGGICLIGRWTKNVWWFERLAWLGFLGLWLNIMEAILYDIEHKNYVNALTGLILCLCQTFSKGHQVPGKAPYYEGVWHCSGINDERDLSKQYLYPIAYCLWNHCFVYYSIGEFGIVHLGVPLLLSAIYSWSYFILYRVYALCAFFYIGEMHKNGIWWFYWDKETFKNLHFRSDYYFLVQRLALFAALSLVYYQYTLYRKDTNPDRVISLAQMIFKAVGLKRKSQSPKVA
jgi:hypothetical protein